MMEWIKRYGARRMRRGMGWLLITGEEGFYERGNRFTRVHPVTGVHTSYPSEEEYERDIDRVLNRRRRERVA